MCSSDLLDRGFEVGQIDPTLFTKRVKGELFVCQLYVDDIIFGSSNKVFNDEFSKLMTDRFKMSMMGELKSFLREGEFWGHRCSKYTGEINLALGHRFTQVRPLLVEVKTYFLLLFIALDLMSITRFRLLSGESATMDCLELSTP